MANKGSKRDKKDKKQPKDKKNVRNVPQGDNLSRISFILNAAGNFSASGEYGILTRALVRNASLISKKKVLRLSPSIKREICKSCDSILIPGFNCTFEVENCSRSKSAKNDVLHVRCLCGVSKRFPVGLSPQYIPFALKDIHELIYEG